MKLHLGIKTDPINTRYSFPWLFDLLAEEGVRYVQVGSFFEMYSLDEAWFTAVKKAADERGLILKSLFTAHRELGGFFYGDIHMEKVARQMCERIIQVGAWLGVDYVGWNPGAIHRDKPQSKAPGLECFHRHLEELASFAHYLGVKALCLEPMSCLSEPPSTPDEITTMMTRAAKFHAANESSTVPVYLCGDISHGVADVNGTVIHNNWDLFAHEAPWLAEFHYKNTDAKFNSTFGFSPEEKARGIVDLAKFKALIEANATKYPVKDLVGYLEIGGPKIGRDYTDPLLGKTLRESLRALKDVYGVAMELPQK
ncbi:MAG: TIM barrel protein [Verrucomicrobiota bacterium]|nr:TIM barrel protein [Verrucomicrobiota bacterium]